MSSQFEATFREHQRQAKAKDEEIEELKRRLSDADAKSKHYLLQTAEAADLKTELNVALKQLKRLETSKTSLQAELEKQMGISQQALKQVGQDQELIRKYVEAATRLQAEVDRGHHNYRTALAECQALATRVDQLDRQLRDREREWREQELVWRQGVDRLEERVQAQSKQVEELQDSRDALEEANHRLELANHKLMRSCEEAEAILHAPKADASCQAGPSQSMMLNLGVQTHQDMRSVAAQIRPLAYTAYSQTPNPLDAVCSRHTQTDGSRSDRPGHRDLAVQTARRPVVSRGCGGGRLSHVGGVTKEAGCQTLVVMVGRAARSELGPWHGGKPARQHGVPNSRHGLHHHHQTMPKSPLPKRPCPDRAMPDDDVGKTKIAGSRFIPASSSKDGGDRRAETRGQSASATNSKKVDKKGGASCETDTHASGGSPYECPGEKSSCLPPSPGPAKSTGILKAPCHAKGREAHPKTVTFRNTLETHFLIPSNPSPSPHHAKRTNIANTTSGTTSNATKPRKRSLQMVVCPMTLGSGHVPADDPAAASPSPTASNAVTLITTTSTSALPSPSSAALTNVKVELDPESSLPSGTGQTNHPQESRPAQVEDVGLDLGLGLGERDDLHSKLCGDALIDAFPAVASHLKAMECKQEVTSQPDPQPEVMEVTEVQESDADGARTLAWKTEQ